MNIIHISTDRHVLLFILLILLFFLWAGNGQAESIGRSVEGRPIELVRLGRGDIPVVLIGGIHGGYEWNTIVLVGELLEHFRKRPDAIPDKISFYIVPNMNPDGLHRITGGTPLQKFDFSQVETAPGRFNGKNVDLNRNWDNNWQPDAWWGQRQVFPGAAPFSEPETRAVRDLVLRLNPSAVIFYHSAADGIYYGGRREEWKPALNIARAHNQGSGYRLPGAGSGGLVSYPITGAASNYFRTKDIPSMVVELSTHHLTEFERNLKGLAGVLEYLTRASP